MKAIDLEVKRICEEKLVNDAKLSELFKNCYPNTMDTTVKTIGEKDTFVITGDIPAMWLRDSTAQVRHYLPVAKHDTEVADCIEGLVNRQLSPAISLPCGCVIPPRRFATICPSQSTTQRLPIALRAS